MSKRRPIGAVLVGGRAQRMGGAKALAPLAGRPLIAWPLAALAAALDDVVVVAKPDTPLPALEVEVWTEPARPVHPRAGIVHALERAAGRSVLVCAGDMPLLRPDVVRAVARARGGPAVVARAGGRLQPLLARYDPPALAILREAPPGEALTATVERLRPHVMEFSDAGPFANVNSPADLAAAAQELARRSGESGQMG